MLSIQSNDSSLRLDQLFYMMTSKHSHSDCFAGDFSGRLRVKSLQELAIDKLMEQFESPNARNILEEIRYGARAVQFGCDQRAV